MNLSAGDGPSEAVRGVRRPVQRPTWAPGGLSGGRLGRQEAHPEAVWGARRPVGSRLARQEARLGRLEARREAVLGARRPVGRPSWPPGGPKRRFYPQLQRNRRFCAVGSRGVPAGMGVPTRKVAKPPSLTGQLLYR